VSGRAALMRPRTASASDLPTSAPREVMQYRTTGRQRHCPGAPDEIRRGDLAIVEQTEHHRVGDQRPELLSEVQRQQWAAVPRTMVDAEIRDQTRRRA
jgi:hypothetical protein